MLVLGVVSGCTSGCATAKSLASLDTAIVLSNTAKHVIEAADSLVTPGYVAAAASAKDKTKGDTLAYNAAMQPWDQAVVALKDVQEAAAMYWLGVSKWQEAESTGGDLASAAAACLATSLKLFGDKIVSVPGGPVLYGALTAIAAELQASTGNAVCTPPPSTELPAAIDRPPIATPPVDTLPPPPAAPATPETS